MIVTTELIFRIEKFSNDMLNKIWTTRGDGVVLLNELVFLRNEKVREQYEKHGPFEIPALAPEEMWWDH